MESEDKLEVVYIQHEGEPFWCIDRIHDTDTEYIKTEYLEEVEDLYEKAKLERDKAIEERNEAVELLRRYTQRGEAK